MTKEKIPEDYQVIDASASLIAKEKFNIRRFSNKHFVVEPTTGEVFMIAFGYGEKNHLANPKGFYCFWVWYQDKEPYGGMLNCELKTKYDSIDYFQAALQNAEETIKTIKGTDGEQAGA